MNDYFIFSIELFTSLAISSAVIFALNPLLVEVLSDACGTKNRSLFWVRFTNIMLIISPLLLVIFFTHTGENSAPNSLIIFKDSLFRALLGEFIGLALVGQMIWHSIRQDLQMKKSNTPTPANEQTA